LPNRALHTYKQGRADAAELLLAKEADVNLQSRGGSTPLHLAAQQGHAEVVQLLLAKEAHVHIKDDAGDTPLDRAADLAT